MDVPTARLGSAGRWRMARPQFRLALVSAVSDAGDRPALAHARRARAGAARHAGESIGVSAARVGAREHDRCDLLGGAAGPSSARARRKRASADDAMVKNARARRSGPAAHGHARAGQPGPSRCASARAVAARAPWLRRRSAARVRQHRLLARPRRVDIAMDLSLPQARRRIGVARLQQRILRASVPAPRERRTCASIRRALAPAASVATSAFRTSRTSPALLLERGRAPRATCSIFTTCTGTRMAMPEGQAVVVARPAAQEPVRRQRGRGSAVAELASAHYAIFRVRRIRATRTRSPSRWGSMRRSTRCRRRTCSSVV